MVGCTERIFLGRDDKENSDEGKKNPGIEIFLILNRHIKNKNTKKGFPDERPFLKVITDYSERSPAALMTVSYFLSSALMNLVKSAEEHGAT